MTVAMNFFNAEPVRFLKDLNSLAAVFFKYIDPSMAISYRLPVCADTEVIVGVSGGADSAVLMMLAAVFLKPNYPNIRFLFTDTGAEPESCYATLDKLEAITGCKIDRVEAEQNLFELIKAYNGFLPNSRSRYCTKKLKIEPLEKYMDGIDNPAGIVNLAGIRWDESDREGISFQHTVENTRGNRSAAYPFIDLRITKDMVFKILDETIGIPSTYIMGRSRSGCFTCFFQRRQELVGMLRYNLPDYLKTESLEKLTENDIQRYGKMAPSLSGHGIHTSLPVPAFIDIRKSDLMPKKAPTKIKVKRDVVTLDMFSSSEDDSLVSQSTHYDTLFVAHALYVKDHLSLFGHFEWTPGVYWQELVNISTTLAGLNSSLAHFYRFRKTTPSPIFDASDMKIVISEIRFPRGTIDLLSPDRESFSWKQGQPLLQLRHLVSHCVAVMEYADLQRQYSEALMVRETTRSETKYLDAEERIEDCEAALAKNPSAPGELIWEGIYTPSIDVEEQVQLQLDGVSIETEFVKESTDWNNDNVPMACIACSI